LDDFAFSDADGLEFFFVVSNVDAIELAVFVGKNDSAAGKTGGDGIEANGGLTSLGVLTG
jgi:hypothetical protein